MRSHQHLRRLPAVVTLTGLVVFLALAVGCRLLYNQTENRLLKQHVAEASQELQLSVGNIKLPLDAAAKLAVVTNGDPASLTTSLASVVGSGTGKLFTSAALYRIGDTTPIAQLGEPTAMPVSGDSSATAMLQKTAKVPFVVVDLLGGDHRRLGYAVADAPQNAKFVVYGERALNANPNVRLRNDQAFSQLDYAIYLGTSATNDHLLGASVQDLPLGGRHAQQATEFGDQHLLLVMRPIGHLSGWLFANLWWMVALLGLLVSAVFGGLIRRLLARRDVALALAEENERLYSEQRHIAETLQMSLLPDTLDAPQGVGVAARYWPAGSASLIGGDFYDLFIVDDDRWGFAIGDVCGKGIEAAALTGLARHTLRTAARHSNTPTEVLEAVHHALRDHQPPTFCTACFGYISRLDDVSFRVELSLGGHPQPLLLHRDARVEAVGTRGTLLGMIDPSLSTASFVFRPGDTLVLYTDGLTDAPADQAVSVEELTTLLEREGTQPIETLADTIRALKRHRRPLGSGDDTALLIMRYELVGASPEGSSPSAGETVASSA